MVTVPIRLAFQCHIINRIVFQLSLAHISHCQNINFEK
jgi:hypothetical protein